MKAMTKEEKIKEFVEFCSDLAISNDSVSEETVLNFINSIQSKENNGWIKIESVEDLPKLTIEYYVLKNGSITTAYYRGNNRWIIPENDYPKTTEIHKITHYQPIEKPKPPLY